MTLLAPTFLLATGFVLAASSLPAAGPAQSDWARLGADGRLAYRTLPGGDRIIDFSFAGYGGGGVPLPAPAAVRTVKPSGADDTAALQAAIDSVAAMPAHGGLRGAVLLAPGQYHCARSLRLDVSGVVLRGSGAEPGGTELDLTGSPHAAIAVGAGERISRQGGPAGLVGAYVPVGSQTIHVDQPERFPPHTRLEIVRPVTAAWLHYMGMDRLTRDGRKETWVGPELDVVRTVTGRDGDRLTLDAPLADSYDAKYLPAGGAKVYPVRVDGGIEKLGVEDLAIVAPPRHVNLTQGLFTGIRVRGVRDAWIRRLRLEDVTQGVSVDGQRVTVEDVWVRHRTEIVGAAKPSDYAADGGQILFLRCNSSGDSEFYVVTGARNQGPNVVLDSVFAGNGAMEPHQRWSTGLLVDNCRVPAGGIALINRGEMGSGHGWTMGWGVVWNCTAAHLVVQNPPGSLNWSIGSIGPEERRPMPTFPNVHLPDLPLGTIDSPNHPVTPSSLYRAQLQDRLGAQALNVLRVEATPSSLQ